MISLNVNNHNLLTLEQQEQDGDVEVTHYGEKYTISPADMVMLLNLYQYIKERDIYNDFINPSGKNRE